MIAYTYVLEKATVVTTKQWLLDVRVGRVSTGEKHRKLFGMMDIFLS